MARVLLRVPASVEKGAVIEMRALIQHVMETGYRPNAEGMLQPRDIWLLYIFDAADEKQG